MTIWILREYFDTLARDIEEMALIDGATRWQAFRMVVAPLAVPGIIAVGVMSFMEAWSEFFFALTLTNSLTYPPLLMSFRNLHQVNWNALAAATTIGVIPPVVVAFVFQRYLVRGLSEGAVEGIDNMPVRLSVLGAGIIAKSFMEAAPDVPELDVAVICDVVEDAARALAEPHGSAWRTNYRRVLEDESIQAVYIALPHHLHEEVAVAAARAGKHILLEKPMANSLDEADRILAAQKQAGVKLMLGFTHRFHSELETAKRLIDGGELGQVTLAVDVMTTGGLIPGWFWQENEAGGGVLHVNGARSFDRLRWLMGSEIVGVFAYAETLRLAQDGGRQHRSGDALRKWRHGHNRAQLGGRFRSAVQVRSRYLWHGRRDTNRHLAIAGVFQCASHLGTAA